MIYLVDTHVLLWWFDNPAKLSHDARSTIQSSQNAIYVSSVSAWEIIIKKQLGKLTVPDRIFSLIAQENFIELPITIQHTRALEALPLHHSDPFDRLLIAQARAEKATIITRDSAFKKYGAPLVLA